MPETLRPLAVITGASSGIGYEFALQCARNGFDLVVCRQSRREEVRGLARGL